MNQVHSFTNSERYNDVDDVKQEATQRLLHGGMRPPVTLTKQQVSMLKDLLGQDVDIAKIESSLAVGKLPSLLLAIGGKGIDTNL